MKTEPDASARENKAPDVGAIGSDERVSTRADVASPQVAQQVAQASDAVEDALAKALEAAAAAGRFDVVAQIAEELKARRLASAGNVVSIERKRGRS